MTEWVYPRPPMAGAIEIDFAQLLASGTNVVGQARQTSLSGVGAPLSVGEWTLYFLRLTYLEAPDLPTPPVNIVSVTLQAGTDRGRADLLGLARTTSPGLTNRVMGNLLRGVAFHVTAGALDAGITYVPGSRAVDDRLLAWVSPGRPQWQWVEGNGVTNATLAAALPERLRVPAFARRIRGQISKSAIANPVEPEVVFYQGPTVVQQVYLPVPAVSPGTSTFEFIVPEEATHFSWVDAGVGATPTTVQFQFGVLS